MKLIFERFKLMIEAFNNNIKTRFEDNDIDTITFLYKILIVSVNLKAIF